MKTNYYLIVVMRDYRYVVSAFGFSTALFFSMYFKCTRQKKINE